MTTIRPRNISHIILSRFLTIAVLALALASGCGGSGESEADRARAESVAAARAQAEKRRGAEQLWREGFRKWSAGALTDALAVGGSFTNQATLTLLFDGDTTARADLDLQLEALKDCSNNVDGIGKAPARFQRARATALSACAHFGAGASLVGIGLAALDEGRVGFSEGLLTRGANEISKGVDLLGKANERLPPETP